MQSIIEKLFYETIEKPINKEETKVSKEEITIYEELRKSLTDEQKNLLLQFDDLKNERRLEEEKELYVLGFQMGARALMEILNLKTN